MSERRLKERKTGGRDEHGRFAPGCAPGPGRPTAAVEETRLAMLSSEIPEATWRRIVQRTVQDALRGNWHARARAREFLARYLLPRPNDAAEFDISVAGRVQVYVPENYRMRPEEEGEED